MSACYVGIDVSKDTSAAQGLSQEGKKLFFIEFPMNAEGFSKLLSTIRTHCKDISEVKAAMESTGCYHSNLFCFLVSEKIQCFVINPLLIANFSKLSLRKTKTDKKDALTIAQFLLLHKDSLSKAAPKQDLQDIKDLAREKESIGDLIAALKNDIRRMLQGTFPELESFCNIFSETMRDFLKRFPSARLVKSAKRTTVIKALTHADGRKRVICDPERLLEAAKRSVASNSTAKELILPEKIATLDHLINQRERISEALVEACQSFMIEEVEIITSIGGISDSTASTFLAEMGDYKAFPSYKHLVAFAGLDPSICQSGKFEGKSRISKRGNRHLRRIVYLMTSCVVRNNHVLKAYFLKRRAEGLLYTKAILATAHKLLRIIFSMLQKKKKFELKGGGAQ